MKGNRTVGTTRIRKSAATAALAQARESVKAAKKRVKEAKAALKIARTDLKAAKKARKEAEVRREAEIAKRATVRRRSVAPKTPAAASRSPSRLKTIAVRKVRRNAATAAIDPSVLIPVEGTGSGADTLSGGVIPASIESGQTLAH